MQFPTEKNFFLVTESAVYVVRRLLFAHDVGFICIYIENTVKGKPLTWRLLYTYTLTVK